jgi:hypothetical protein
MKTIISVLAVLICLNCFGQADSTSVKEKYATRWGFSVAYNSAEAQIDQQLINTWTFARINYYDNFSDKTNRSYSLSIFPEYYLKNNILMRFEFGMTNINLLSHYNAYRDSVSAGFSFNTIVDDTLRQKIYKFSPGIQWKFAKNKIGEIYCGGIFNYSWYSELSWIQNIKSNDVPGRGTIYRAKTPGGFATGIGAFSGFNINLTKNIKVGCELSYSLLYYRLGGKEKGETIGIYPSTTLIQEWVIENNKSKGIQFSKVMPSFHIAVRL